MLALNKHKHEVSFVKHKKSGKNSYHGNGIVFDLTLRYLPSQVADRSVTRFIVVIDELQRQRIITTAVRVDIHHQLRGCVLLRDDDEYFLKEISGIFSCDNGSWNSSLTYDTS